MAAEDVQFALVDLHSLLPEIVLLVFLDAHLVARRDVWRVKMACRFQPVMLSNVNRFPSELVILHL